MDRSRLTPHLSVVALAVLAVLGFAASMMAPVLVPDRPTVQGVPLMFVAALWAVPLGLALIRGERWAFTLALAILLFSSDASFRARHWADKSIDLQVLMKMLVWGGCGFIGLVHLPRVLRLLATPPAFLALAFILVLLVSTLWSPTPTYSFASAALYLCLFVFALAAASILDERSLLTALALGYGLIVLPSLAIAPFAAGISGTSPGSTGEADRLRGITDHAIPLAETAALFIFACVVFMARTKGGARLGFLLLAVAGAVTLVLTQSRIAAMAMVAAGLGFVAYRKGGWLLMVPTIVACLMLVLMMESVGGFGRMLPADMLEIFSRSGHAKEILSLSGRLEIWPYVLDKIAAAPILGYGHASGMEVFRGFMPWKITHAHNSYLQALLYVGVVGMALLVAALLCQLVVFFRDPQPIRDTVLLYEILKGLTEQSMLSNMPSSSVVLWMVTVGLAGQAWRRAPARERAPRAALQKAVDPQDGVVAGPSGEDLGIKPPA